MRDEVKIVNKEAASVTVVRFAETGEPSDQTDVLTFHDMDGDLVYRETFPRGRYSAIVLPARLNRSDLTARLNGEPVSGIVFMPE